MLNIFKQILAIVFLVTGIPLHAFVPDISTSTDNLFPKVSEFQIISIKTDNSTIPAEESTSTTIITKDISLPNTTSQTVTEEVEEPSVKEEEYTIVTEKVGPGPIRFETEQVYNDNLCVEGTKILQDGVDGLRYTELTYKVYSNGEKELISKESITIEEPVNKILMIGTMDCNVVPESTSPLSFPEH